MRMTVIFTLAKFETTDHIHLAKLDTDCFSQTDQVPNLQISFEQKNARPRKHFIHLGRQMEREFRTPQIEKPFSVQ